MHLPCHAQVKYFCNVTNEECSARRYHCIRMPDVDLSPAAYAAGKFPPGCSSKDFVLIDQAEFQVSLGFSDAKFAFVCVCMAALCP